MLDIAIIGAGPAGLAAALRLHQKGLRPRIYETVPELKPLGVGIDVKVYGSKELDELGLLEEFRAISVDAEESIFYNKYGQEIYAELCGKHMGYLYEQRFVHRGYLQMLLYRTVLDRLGADAVVQGVRCTGYINEDESVLLDLEHEDGGREQVRADVVIAADGIKSVVRQQMHPEHSEPVYSGITMWRGTTLMEPFRGGHTILHIGAPQISSMIVYPIADDFEGTGKVLVNWVVEAERDETVEDWNQLGGVEEILSYYDQFELDFLDVQQMLRDAREVYLFPLIRHEPLDTWTDGRVVLIGDAAHAMYPRGGNGACQAIVDGGVLAEKLATIDDVPEALKAFEEQRLQAVNGIVMAHRGEGYEVVRRMVEDRTGGQRFDDIENVLPLTEADEIFSKYHKLVGQERPGWEQGQATGFRTWQLDGGSYRGLV
ncbi:2-polyprenyl-6-methoxyphenol hydroxylase-like FAD-dependent oxidoreductase [Promicromonospora sp. AC04]|uniref:FAD-dependent monooxygenase n=1 Tax=Promicromonospora sp. AC04 TaxID=2135723 RepID=UPI000D357EDA|nr:FAD-dependent monooxygenase [Promicromonospora sp. AC04]PUB32296.1 2-polyprenyl-6-methoxyphenol hydroxylase-like FAD-dependent oxidoreductase [Promicromonospora sp. AC04]